MLRDRGMGIIYISHKMAEIKRISDEITVMRDGQLVATRPASELEMNDIIRLMVGRELGNQFPSKTNKPGEVYLEVEHLTGLYNNLRTFPSPHGGARSWVLRVWTAAAGRRRWKPCSASPPARAAAFCWTARSARI